MIARIRNAITAAWSPHIQKDVFNFGNIVFEGSTDDVHNTVARIDVWGRNAQDPLHIRISQVDLGEDPAAWTPILAHRLNVARKQIRARESMTMGREKFGD